MDGGLTKKLIYLTKQPDKSRTLISAGLQMVCSILVIRKIHRTSHESSEHSMQKTPTDTHKSHTIKAALALAGILLINFSAVVWLWGYQSMSEKLMGS
jgi:hypothetical protein